jgi:DNA-binding transcriptional MerR regulator
VRDTRDIMAPEPGRTYAIGELAEQFGLTPRTLRFYEDEGLLSPRREGTTRVYTHRDWARLKLICRGKRLGFSVQDIKDFMVLYDAGDRQIPQMRFALALGRNRITQLEQQLKDVQQTLMELRDIDRQIVDHFRHQGIDLDGPDSADEEPDSAGMAASGPSLAAARSAGRPRPPD